jgi:hypothetical protein
VRIGDWKRSRADILRLGWRRIARSMLGALLALFAASSAGAQGINLSPMQAAALEMLIDEIKSASREAFESGDWSLMASVYPEGTFACWNASGEAHRHAFLSMEAIPERFFYEVSPLPKDYDFGNVDASKMQATHVLTVAYERSLPASCGLEHFRGWGIRDFFLRLEGEWFELVHPCPTREQIERKAIVRTWPAIDRPHVKRIVDGMSAAERAEVRRSIKRDRFPHAALALLESRYRLDESRGLLVLDEVCRRTK